MMRRPFLLLSVLLAAQGCAGGGETAALEAALANARAGAAAVAGSPSADTPRLRAPRPVPVTRTDRAEPPPAGLPRAASQLLGAGPEALVATLGEPVLRREEGGASVWLYSGAGCHLDIVLYPGRDGGLRVAHVQARAGGIAQRSEATCLRELADRPRRLSPSGLPERHSQA